MTHVPRDVHLAEVVSRFQMGGRLVDVVPYGSGHIHDTFSVVVSESDRHGRYILQRINQHVLMSPVRLMENIVCVTRHLHDKLAAQAVSDPERRVLSLVPTVEGGNCHRDAEGHYWRGYRFIENATTFDVPEGPDHAYQAARAYGCFQAALMDLPVEQLHETIPDFHDTRKRYDVLVEAIESDRHDRAKAVRDELLFVREREAMVDVLVALNADGILPTRITHNDTKLNNVMIDDATGEGICVIDLDTVMPGLFLYDYGDCIRGAVGMCDEDESDVLTSGIDLGLYKAITEGYLSAVGGVLSPREIELLPLAARLMTLESGMRFLTDYLDGDVYFKTQREHQNLDRCRVQFAHVQAMEDRHDEIKSIVGA